MQAIETVLSDMALPEWTLDMVEKIETEIAIESESETVIIVIENIRPIVITLLKTAMPVSIDELIVVPTVPALWKTIK